ncbi:hybrid sensor histidine kinase/response regulator transcription factor [Viscerimonas tarda]
MSITKFIPLCLCLLSSILPLFSDEGNNFHFYQISTKEGLSQNTVRTILEDKKGFIWAGTLNGLNRYDGYQIVTYKPHVGDSHSLIDHRIKDVFQDKDGLLWIKTYKNGFSCYDPVIDTFTNYWSEDANESVHLFSNYFEASTGDIWLWGNANGCLKIKKDKGDFISTLFLNEEQSERQANCRFLFEDSKSAIWAGGNQGLYRITDGNTEVFFIKGLEKRSFTKAVELNNKIYFSAEESSIMEYDLKSKLFHEIKYTAGNKAFINLSKLSSNELLIVSRSSELFSFNINNRQFYKPKWSDNKDLTGNMDFIIDKNEGIWIYNGSGIVWYYNPGNLQCKKMTLIPSDIVKIIDYERYNIFIDSKNLIWITTYGNGIFCYDPQTDKLDNYLYNPNQNSPASNYILAITEDKFGNIWIGSEYAGIIKVTKPKYSAKIVRPETLTSIGKNNNVKAIYESSSNEIWVGTKNSSLYVYDDDLSAGKNIYKDLNPYALLEDKQLRMWVGTKGNGLWVLNSINYNLIAHFTHVETDDKSLSGNTIFNILQDNKGRIWLGLFGNGINLVEEQGNKISFRHFFENDGNRSYVRYLYQDSKGLIWVGCSDGLIRFDPDELMKNPKAFVTYHLDLKRKNSLNSNDVMTIYEDNSGQVWIGTSGGGLNKYVKATDKEEEHFVAYTTEEGLSGDIVSGIIEDHEQNLWISGESGISKFDQKNNSFISYYFSDFTYGNHFNANANLISRNGNMYWGSLDGLLVFNPDSFISDTPPSPVTFTNFFLYDQKVTVGDKDSPLEKAVPYAEKIELNYKQNTFTIEFASLTSKNQERTKYSYKLTNYDRQWSAASYLNTATYKNIAPGKYTFMVRCCNSDGIWNDEIAEIEIIINPPFWKSVYAYIIYVLLAVLLVYITIRLANKFYTLNNTIEVEKQLTNHKLRFFTNISHEFRTPLTLIRGAIENLNEQAEVPERIKRHINMINKNSTILTRLIDQLLEFRKLQNNVLRLDLEETDIIDFVKEIYSGFQEIAQQKQIEYNFSTDISSFKMYIDRRKIDKIIYNLLSNAFKFTPKEGKIDVVIGFNYRNETCVISIKDNGIGIDKEKQHLLFSRFMQINFSASGTGVGLSLVKEFIDVHKGKVWYETNNDQGSVFNVELSTSKETYKGENFIQTSYPDVIESKTDSLVMYPSESMEIARPNIDDSTLANYKMLIIDDNDDIRNFLVDEFSNYFMCDVAENGKEGLGKAIDNNPDLIICDVMMPEMDGFEVTRRLKEEFQTCHIPIILLTAHSSLEHQLEGIQSGADAYIMKPFSLKYLVTKVFKLIEQREQLKKRFSNESIIEGNIIPSTSKDKEFYELIGKILEEHYADSSFSVDKFAELTKLKRTIFYKKVKGITGLPPNELIKIKRLKKATELLLVGELTVSEISYKVGFDDPFYFSKCFKAHYNCSPRKFGLGEQPPKFPEGDV